MQLEYNKKSSSCLQDFVRPILQLCWVEGTINQLFEFEQLPRIFFSSSLFGFLLFEPNYGVLLPNPKGVCYKKLEFLDIVTKRGGSYPIRIQKFFVRKNWGIQIGWGGVGGLRVSGFSEQKKNSLISGLLPFSPIM